MDGGSLGVVFGKEGFEVGRRKREKEFVDVELCAAEL